MEVPDLIAKFDGFFPDGTAPTSIEGIAAARMLTPGAIISGCYRSGTTSEILDKQKHQEKRIRGV
jgi:hypothetical protein